MGQVGQEILESAEPYRMLGVAYYDAGFRSFYVNGRDVQLARRPGRASRSA